MPKRIGVLTTNIWVFNPIIRNGAWVATKSLGLILKRRWRILCTVHPWFRLRKGAQLVRFLCPTTSAFCTLLRTLAMRLAPRHPLRKATNICGRFTPISTFLLPIKKEKSKSNSPTNPATMPKQRFRPMVKKSFLRPTVRAIWSCTWWTLTAQIWSKWPICWDTMAGHFFRPILKNWSSERAARPRPKKWLITRNTSLGTSLPRRIWRFLRSILMARIWSKWRIWARRIGHLFTIRKVKKSFFRQIIIQKKATIFNCTW